MFAALKALKNLPPGLQAAIRDKRVSGEYTLATLLHELNALAEFDRTNDGNRGSIGTAMVFLVIGLILDIFLSILLFPPLLLLGVGLIVAMIYLGIQLRRLGKLDLSNNFREVALPFLAVLKQDVEAHQPIAVELDLTAPTATHKKKAVGQPYKHGAYYKVVDTAYQDAWFRGSARLADGGLLGWAVADEIVESQRSKRNGRGKHKTKTRHYKRSIIDVSVALPTKTYAVRPPPPPQPGLKLALERGAKRDTLSLTRKFKAKSLDPIPADLLIGCIAEAYRLAQPAHARSAA